MEGMKIKVGTFYCTKRALTAGIIKFEGEEVTYNGLSTIKENRAKYFIHGGSYIHGTIGKDMFHTLEEAKERAMQMAQDKVQSLVKQLDRARKLEWDYEQGNIPVME